LYMDKGRILGANEVTNGEDGEVEDANNQIEYDTSKLQEWPGFNVDPPKGSRDDTKYHRVPPMQEHQSLTVMKERMGQFEQKAYVRGEMQNTNVVKEKEGDSSVIEEGEEDATPAVAVQHTPFETCKGTPMVVKSKDSGTPICSLYSPFQSLPDAAKWMTNTTDHIFFENLPESTGKYEKMAELLKKARKTRAAIEKAAAKAAVENNLTPGGAVPNTSEDKVEELSPESPPSQT